MIALLVFLISPLLATLIAAIGLILGKKKNKMIYIFIISFALAIIAYHYNPPSSDDLYRHHIDVVKMMSYSSTTIMDNLFNSTEQISYIIKYFVSLTGNVDYLQFIVTLISYFIIIYIVTDSATIKKSSKLDFIIVALFTILSFSYLTICSNLWSTLGLVVFSLGLYLEYSKETKKIWSYMLYISSIFIHTSLFFPLVLLVLFKLLKEKVSFKMVYTLFLIFIMIGPIINFLTANVDIALVREISGFYNSYFINNSDFAYLHTTSVLIIYLLKLLPYFVIYLFFKTKTCKKADFAFVILIAILGLMPSSTFAIRFIPIVQLAGVAMLLDFMKNANREFKILMILFMICMIFVLTLYQYQQLNDKFGIDLVDISTRNIVSIFSK